CPRACLSAPTISLLLFFNYPATSEIYTLSLHDALPILTLVKYVALGLAGWFVYLSARRLLGERPVAALAAFALVLMVPLGWVVHETLTHSLAVVAAAAATFYALLRLEATGRRSAHAALGPAPAPPPP